MWTLVLTVCATFGGDVHCERFDRKFSFNNEQTCTTVAELERGQYQQRVQQRPWAEYAWHCEQNAQEKAVQ